MSETDTNVLGFPYGRAGTVDPPCECEPNNRVWDYKPETGIAELPILRLSKPVEDVVNHPAHYNAGPIEIIDIIEQIVTLYKDHPKVAYSIGQIIKYVSRAPLKDNMLTDLKKAKWYLIRAIRHLEK